MTLISLALRDNHCTIFLALSAGVLSRIFSLRAVMISRSLSSVRVHYSEDTHLEDR